MNIGDFVLSIAILFLCLEISTNYDGQLHKKKDARILVLGAGMSGISAAKTLHDAGYQNILILEASPRIGGRIKSTKVGNYTVELGAMWIYGKGTNPVYNMAMANNITMSNSFAYDWTVRNEEGRDLTKAADAAYVNLKSALSDISELARNITGDFTATAALRFLNWTARTEIEEVIEAYTIDFETGIHPSALSGKNLNLDETYNDFGSFDMFAVTHEDGFADMLGHMLDTFLHKNDDRLMFNKTITDIKYDDDLVTVKTSDGETIEGDFAVVTFSLGVLQQRLVNFSPPLPAKKRLAIDMFGMSAYSHIYVQFAEAFWDKTMYILYASKFRGKHSFWQNLNSIYPGSNILQLSLFDQDALWVDRNPDEVVIEELLRALRKIYPNKYVPEPTNYAISRWNSDPLSMGAFSYWPVGFTKDDMIDLQAPVGRVHFAGEYLDPLHYGFVHAAFLSGQRTAYRIIQHLRDCPYLNKLENVAGGVLNLQSYDDAYCGLTHIRKSLFKNIFQQTDKFYCADAEVQ